MNEIKKPLAAIYAWLIILGMVIGPIGMLGEFPVIGAVGNALFLAGFFTPVLFQKKLTTKDAVFGGIWFSTVLHFGLNGAIDLHWLLAFFPVLGISMIVSKWAGASFTRPSEINN